MKKGWIWIILILLLVWSVSFYLWVVPQTRKMRQLEQEKAELQQRLTEMEQQKKKLAEDNELLRKKDPHALSKASRDMLRKTKEDETVYRFPKE